MGVVQKVVTGLNLQFVDLATTLYVSCGFLTVELEPVHPFVAVFVRPLVQILQY